jgi:methylmalonyl-CoA mutase N-terminal domain/subunit
VAEGLVQAELNRQQYRHEKDLQSGAFKKVGVNCFVQEEEKPEVAFHPYREEEARKQIESLKEIRRRRDAGKVASSLERLKAVAAARENVMPAVMTAVETYATVGEVCGAFREVLGSYREPIRL